MLCQVAGYQDRIECEMPALSAADIVIEITNNGMDYTSNKVQFTVLPQSNVTSCASFIWRCRCIDISHCAWVGICIFSQFVLPFWFVIRCRDVCK